MTDTTDETDSRLIAGFWQVVAAHGWDGVTLRRLAAASDLPAAAIRARAPQGPGDLLRLHERLADEAVAAGTVPGQGGTPRDRVFDVVMRRIDAMQPHRAGILRLVDDLRLRPGLALCLLAQVPPSMARLLDAAEIESGGIYGAVRAQGLAGIWLATLRAWTRDDTADLGATMAALDRALDRAEQVARSLRLDPGDMAAS
ncbi:TetR family transcriptional regulator [Paracraurococcus lichenis]|uniref:TetR family transcriptional regulator n=1 Tax=Paracraurococcus lichenis TaxID=3064888 RepID=A0ABT9E4Q4_9PROT|nr:TetR family transcriptional regulator [Paracraurococcus sp. LOR1-02]MDO9711142.1 TetR family transcriptional regulator [Paracraurococcus sp. LOR1-02]